LARAQADRLPRAAWVVRLRSEFSRKQFVSASSDLLKRAVRAELELLLGRVLTPVATRPESVHVV
jgi:ribonuclease P protein component